MKHIAGSPETRRILLASQERPQHWHILHYFFDYRAGNTLPNTVNGLYRHLLLQIIEKCALSAETLPQHRVDLDSLTRLPDADSTIDLVVRMLVSEAIEVFVLVDGLDECSDNKRLVVQSIRSLCQRTRIRACIASRPEPSILTLLKGCPTIRVQEFNNQGVRQYVRASLSSIQTALVVQSMEPGELIAQIVEDLSRKACGVFIWAHFATGILADMLVRGCTLSEAKQELKELPQELKEMYDRILAQIPMSRRVEAALILHLVASYPSTARLSLNIQQLFGAVNWLVHRYGLMTDYIVSTIEHFEARLEGIVGSFLRFSRREPRTTDPVNMPDHHRIGVAKVYLLHETVSYHINSRSIVQAWLGDKLLSIYPDKIWLRLAADIVKSVEIAADAWTIVPQSMADIYGISRPSSKSRWDWQKYVISNAMTGCLSRPTLVGVRGSLSTRDFARLLLDAVDLLRNDIEFDSSKFALDVGSATINSPLVTLLGHREYGGEGSTRCAQAIWSMCSRTHHTVVDTGVWTWPSQQLATPRHTSRTTSMIWRT